MKDSAALAGLPTPVRQALEKLGEDLSTARRRRRLTMEIVSERAFITRKTLNRVERGDPGVSIGIYASVLFVMGMIDRVSALADGASDTLGLTLEDEQLPKRVRRRTE